MLTLICWLMLYSSAAQEQHAANELRKGLNDNISAKSRTEDMRREISGTSATNREQTYRPLLVPQTLPLSCLLPRINGSCAVRSGTDCNRAPPCACLTDSPTMHWGWRLTSCLDLRSATHRNPHSQLKLMVSV